MSLNLTRQWFMLAWVVQIIHSWFVVVIRFHCGLFDPNFMASDFHPIKIFDGRFGLTRLGHFDKAKSLGHPRLWVYHQGAGLDIPIGLKQVPDVCFGGTTGEVAD
jgi:hypothetical protein